jgi:hypothetical protein
MAQGSLAGLIRLLPKAAATQTDMSVCADRQGCLPKTPVFR